MTIQAQRIKDRRTQLGLSQDDVAARTGISQKQISRYEKGSSDPSGSNLAVLADALETTTDWLLGRTDMVKPVFSESELDASEQEIIQIYRRVPVDERRKIRKMLEVAAG